MYEKERPAFYLVCGYVLKTVLGQHPYIKTCVSCYSSVIHKEATPHRYGIITRICNYAKDKNSLVEVSNDVFELILHCEEKLFMMHEQLDFRKSEDLAKAENILLSYESNLPTCYSLASMIIRRFFKMRTTLGWDLDKNDKEELTSQLGSLTMGAKFLAG